MTKRRFHQNLELVFFFFPNYGKILRIFFLERWFKCRVPPVFWCVFFCHFRCIFYCFTTRNPAGRSTSVCCVLLLFLRLQFLTSRWCVENLDFVEVVMKWVNLSYMQYSTVLALYLTTIQLTGSDFFLKIEQQNVRYVGLCLREVFWWLWGIYLVRFNGCVTLYKWVCKRISVWSSVMLWSSADLNCVAVVSGFYSWACLVATFCQYVLHWICFTRILTCVSSCSSFLCLHSMFPVNPYTTITQQLSNDAASGRLARRRRLGPRQANRRGVYHKGISKRGEVMIVPTPPRYNGVLLLMSTCSFGTSCITSAWRIFTSSDVSCCWWRYILLWDTSAFNWHLL